MKTSVLFSILASTLLSYSATVSAQEDVADVIITNAETDNIDLTVIDFYEDVLDEIAEIAAAAPIEETASTKRSLSRAAKPVTPSPNNIVDVHAHFTPKWYKNLVPTTGGNPTPDWDITTHEAFNRDLGVDRAVFAFSAPGPNAYLENKKQTVALARLINEESAALCKRNKKKYKFYAHVPFPYTQEAITEAKYAINKLGAVGIFLQSSVEGKYLGDASLKPFFQAINQLGGRQILYIHPTTPMMKVGKNWIEANPTDYITGKIEFYFETARTVMDLTLTQTIHNFTNIHYIIPHTGGAFPATMDRILKSYPTIYDSSLNIYNTRFWWDSAGPTYFHQVSGLLGMGVPKSQLLFGTDYPYAPLAPQAPSLLAIKNSPLFTAAEKTAVFSGNAERLFAGKW